MLIDKVLLFLASLEFWQLIANFWPFFLIDFFRYVVIDIFVALHYLSTWNSRSNERIRLRKELFRENPLVSVIVPGKNEGAHIPRLVKSLQQQTYKNIEVIVVDDGSDDQTETICRQLEVEKSITTFIRNEVRGGKASAANTAFLYSNGEYILHIDADSYLLDNSIETILLPFFKDKSIGVVGGDVRVSNTDDSLTSGLQAIEYMKTITTARTVLSMLGILRIVAGAHGMFRRDVLERLKGWDVGPGLDGDITLKIRKLGYRVVHEPHAICYTHAPISPTKLARQRYRWDRSLIRFRARKHADILLPSASFNLLNFISSADNLFFNVVLDFKWWIYIIQLTVFYPHLFGIILIINLFIYTLVNVIEYITARLMFGQSIRPNEKKLVLLLPLMPIYTGLFIRGIRTYAYIMEFFHKTSYTDKWNPWKVSKIAKKEKL